MCSGEMRHCYLEKGKTLFHIGDVGDKFYIVLQGRVAVLQPTPITDQMTGFELYRHLLNLRKNNEMYMFNLTLDANKNIVDIDKRDLEQLNLMVLVMCIQDYFSHVNFIGRTIPEILTLCGVDPHFFDGIIDESNNEARDANLLENVEHKIFDRLPKFDQTIIQRYRILSNNVVRFKVNLFKYKNIIELGKGTFFGDTALDKLTTRNATIQTTDDTHFCFLGNNHYSSYIKLEKERLTNKEINFIVDNFFLKDIPYKLFEQKVFANFYYHELTKREIICQENQPLEYLYFIKEGIIELSIKKNIPELYETTTNLSKLDYTCLNPPASTFPIIKPYPKDHVAKVNFLYKTTKTKIYNYSQKEVIGFESLCFNINYLYTAEVISDKVKLYKVHKSYVMKLLNEDIFKKVCASYARKRCLNAIFCGFIDVKDVVKSSFLPMKKKGQMLLFNSVFGWRK
jgi:CRP-like cAMP-binding protein